VLAAVPVPENPSFRLARNAAHHPLVLLESVGAPPAMPPLALEHVRIEHARPCRVQLPGGSLHSGIFTIFACTSGEVVLQEHFLMVAGALIATMPKEPHSGMVAQAVETMAELFRALEAPARSSVQGLWSELFLIAESRRPADLARAWRVSLDDRFDFSTSAVRIEVKSTRGVDRVHYFSLEQLRPPAGAHGIVASIRVEHAGGGVSIDELLDEIRVALSDQPDLLLRVETIVATTLGSTFRVAIVERFDREAARESLAYFRVEDVPSVREPLPHTVSDVHFRSDLSSVAPAMPRAITRYGGDELLECLPAPGALTRP